MKANEFRIGNYHYYRIEDKLDERKEWDEACVIDAEDLAWLSMPQGELDPDYKPIPITQEWLKKAGFKLWEETKESETWVLSNAIDGSSHFEVLIIKESGKSLPAIDGQVCYWGKEFWLHTLQNLYFGITGNELTFK